jgi:hypothetical protein
MNIIEEKLKKEKYLIIDDLLSKEEVDLIEKQLYDSFFPWYLSFERDEHGNFYTAPLSLKDEWKNDKNLIDRGHFVHLFLEMKNSECVQNSNYINEPIKILVAFGKKMNVKIYYENIMRVKANLIMQHKDYTKKSYGVPHLDTLEEHYVLIYYVNDSDGDTVLFNEDKKIFARISPKRGRLLMFNGNTLHAGGHPLVSKSRCVINFDLKIKD